jgi:hypothetical protein
MELIIRSREKASTDKLKIPAKQMLEGKKFLKVS